MGGAASLLDALRGIVGPAAVLTEADDIAPFGADWRGRYRGDPSAVVRPAKTDEVAAVVAACAAANVAIVPQGGNTGLCGGATPIGGEVLLSLGRMNRVRHIDVANNSITVDAGCILEQVQDAAAAADRLFPLSLAAEGSATIGGNLSTNAGGVHVLRYGNMRDLVLGLEVVLADGQIWHGLRALRKDNSGYDLKHWFIGAEGTLGIITAATLKLVARPTHRAVAWVAVPTPEHAIGLLAALRGMAAEAIEAFELIGASALDVVLRMMPGARAPLPSPSPWYVLVELASTRPVHADLEDGLAQAIEHGLATDAVMAASEAQARTLWSLRESISDAQKREGVSIKHDIAVPVSAIPSFIARADAALGAAYPDVRIVCFGHVGDGNLHYNLSMSDAVSNVRLVDATPAINRIVHDVVNELGGSISAEHGIGQLRRGELAHYRAPLELQLMRRIKSALDPHGLFNPGKVL